ncbi:MAG TPA: HAD family phosphatase [Baekduia sp.]|nr:HAD family phosphatase [Baekduia sp.]
MSVASRDDAPEAVVFDNDGLLLDTEEAWTRAETTLFERHGHVFTYAHKRDMIGSSHLVAAGKLEAMLDQPGNGLALMAELDELVMDAVRAEVPPRPGAVALVTALLAAGRPIALATNSPRRFCERALRSASMDGLFEVIVAGDEVAHGKPAPDIYIEACRRLGVDPARSVALEDSPAGTQAARAAGMTVIGIPYLDDIELPAADLVASSLAAPEVAERCGL